MKGLFEEESSPGQEPVASRMRPRKLSDVVGQEHMLAPGSALHAAIESDRVPSIILWGPPGCGKTTLAAVIAEQTHKRFVSLSAVSAGVSDIRRVISEARQRRDFNEQATILFIDEIHRFNKAQQDAVLPAIEDGTITLIGATTENPGFEVNNALLSRCRVFQLKSLRASDIVILLRRALENSQQGLGSSRVSVDDHAMGVIAKSANGDARAALTVLETAVVHADAIHERVLTDETLQQILQRPVFAHDKTGDLHYDLVSALIKSVRGSDPDAALYYLARMLHAGEDLMFVARRLVLAAAEDVGLADPHALVLAVACQQAAHLVGMPEAFLPLSECAVYLALAPKSNSAYDAYKKALATVERTGPVPIPLHLRNAVTAAHRSAAHGRDYRYPHDYAGHHVRQQYLPDDLQEERLYVPGSEGIEPQLYERWSQSTREPHGD